MKNTHYAPLISVIVPVYNAAPYLSKCVASIANQTYANLEIILVDDGSTDGSGKICDTLGQFDDRIKVIHKENGGTVSARKRGIIHAKGEYAAYVDSDDWIEPDMFEIMLRKMKDADVVICGIERDFGSSISYETNCIEAGIYHGEQLEDFYSKMIYTGNFFERGITPYVFGKLFKTDLLEKNQMCVPEEIRVAEDPACLYPTLLEANKIVVLPDCFYHYQMRDDSVMGTNDGNEIVWYKVFYSYLKKRFSEKRQWKNCLMPQLDYLMTFMLMLRNIEIFQADIPFLFPYGYLNQGARIVVYGAGRFGHELIRYLRSVEHYTLTAWVDRNTRENIQSPSMMDEIEFDYVLVAVLMENTRKEIFNQIRSMGIADNKIKMIDMMFIEKERHLIESRLSDKIC